MQLEHQTMTAVSSCIYTPCSCDVDEHQFAVAVAAAAGGVVVVVVGGCGCGCGCGCVCVCVCVCGCGCCCCCCCGCCCFFVVVVAKARRWAGLKCFLRMKWVMGVCWGSRPKSSFSLGPFQDLQQSHYCEGEFRVHSAFLCFHDVFILLEKCTDAATMTC